MKKLLLTTVCAFFLIACYSQELQKGNAIGHHVGIVKLSPDATYNQWKSFMISEWIPALNKEFEGDCKAYFIEGERGRYEGSAGVILAFNSVETRDKYWPEFQKSSEVWKTIYKKLLPLKKKFDELGEFKIESSSTWVVQ